jgi:hypothetical protein
MTIPTTTPGTLARARTQIATVVRRIAATGALALTVFGLSVPAASAGESEQIRTKGGEIEFEDTGDILRAVDTRRDGYAVRARLSWFDPVTRTLQTSSLTDPTSAGTWKSRQLAVPEGFTVRLRMCYIDNGHAVKCSNEQDAVA